MVLFARQQKRVHLAACHAYPTFAALELSNMLLPLIRVYSVMRRAAFTAVLVLLLTSVPALAQVELAPILFT
jgi:hypothetical protein